MNETTLPDQRTRTLYSVLRITYHVSPFTLLPLFALALLLPPHPALAALGVSSVTPNVVSSAAAAILTINGSDFASGAVASLDGYGSLSTTFVNSTTLTAILPAGAPVGTYTLTVTNPDTSSASLPHALTVLAPTVTPTVTPVSEATPTTEPPPAGYERPIIIVQSSGASVESVSMGQDFTISVQLYNAGQKTANNVVATFASGDLVPRDTGGVIAVGQIHPGNHAGISQPVTASNDLWGKAVVSIDMTLAYMDDKGTGYSEKFTLTFPVAQPRYSAPTATRTPTPTPTQTLTATAAPLQRPQLVITRYTTSVSPLQPGAQFVLTMDVQNLGNADAKRVTMIVGGGSASSGGGTPDGGGTSGGGGDFTNFAPLGSSNVQSLGDLAVDGSLSASQTLIVNVSTNPGAYPFKISFTYTDERNLTFTDDQVVTLLVYSIPVVDIGFYTDPGALFAGQPGLLPLQIVNLGRKSAVLGNMRVEAAGAQLSNNVILIGTLESGGYFTLDATAIPDQPGLLELLVTVSYTDDFNQPQVISKTLTVEVMEAEVIGPEGPGGEPGGGGIEPIPAAETFWQKLWRFILGLLGLDSAQPQLEGGGPMPVEIQPGGEPLPGGPPGKMP